MEQSGTKHLNPVCVQQINLINQQTILAYPVIRHGMKHKDSVSTVHWMEHYGIKHLNPVCAQQINLISIQRIDVFLAHHQAIGIK